MRKLLVLAGCAGLLTGCGAASDVTSLAVSTPDRAALAVAESNVQDGNTAMSAYFATTFSVFFSPEPPIMIGGRGC